MTHDEVMKLMERLELPFAYDHFEDGESPDPPFSCFLYPKAKNFSADNIVYFHTNALDIEVYTDFKDPELEEKIEAILNEAELYYEKSEVWIESERMYEVFYPRCIPSPWNSLKISPMSSINWATRRMFPTS